MSDSSSQSLSSRWRLGDRVLHQQGGAGCVRFIGSTQFQTVLQTVGAQMAEGVRLKTLEYMRCATCVGLRGREICKCDSESRE